MSGCDQTHLDRSWLRFTARGGHRNSVLDDWHQIHVSPGKENRPRTTPKRLGASKRRLETACSNKRPALNSVRYAISQGFLQSNGTGLTA
jgi:hypothetical protein